jgi:delta24-sterol reductase
MFCDIALVQTPGPVRRGEPYDPVGALRALERFLIEHRGYQALYATTCLSREEYRTMFDCTLYDRVRRAYGAEGVFMDAYAKVRRAAGHRRGRT